MKIKAEVVIESETYLTFAQQDAIGRLIQKSSEGLLSDYLAKVESVSVAENDSPNR